MFLLSLKKVLKKGYLHFFDICKKFDSSKIDEVSDSGTKSFSIFKTEPVLILKCNIHSNTDFEAKDV